MSTKIYNGYKSKLGLEELLKKFVASKIEIKEAITKSFRKEVVEKYVQLIDGGGEIERGIKGLNFIYRAMDKELRAVPKHEIAFYLDSCIEYGLNVCVFPLNGETLILAYSNNSEITPLWEGLDYIEEYHYQNQSDKPEELSEEEWDKRESDWNAVLNGDGWGVPADLGYQYEFWGRELPNIWFGLFKDSVELESYIPTAEVRKKRILINKIWEETVPIIKDKNGGVELSDYTNYRMDFLNKYNQGEYKDQLDLIVLENITF